MYSVLRAVVASNNKYLRNVKFATHLILVTVGPVLEPAPILPGLVSPTLKKISSTKLTEEAY